ncbi:MAG: sigma 54-interacting transcriptional regulator, partial [Desulfitobacteriaceae bacterium]|nr:sigma 54-interacting transcriptional regulator [Desulfitobacteriaceae bacterium]
MFRPFSETWKLENLMLHPVKLIEPNQDRTLLTRNMTENGLAAGLWPVGQGWGAILLSALQQASDGMEVNDLKMSGFSIDADASVKQLLDYLEKHPGEAAIVVDLHNTPLGVIESSRLSSLMWKEIQQMGASITTMMDTVSEAITVIDQNNLVIGWNKAAEALYRIDGKTIIGEDIGRFFSSLVVTHVINTDMPKKRVVRNNYHQPLPETHVLINASPLIFEDKILGSVCAERDITETVRLHNELSKASSEVRQLKSQITKTNPPQNSFEKICGLSRKLQETISLSRRVAKTNAAVLIRGESGTGKELFAEAIHKESARNNQPFVIINCGAIPAPLYESELFGYQPGAFTGADRKGRQGKFELANGGSIFLDEIGEMPGDMQVKLLRVLQNKCFYRVGGNDPVEVDVRVIAATHRDLEQMIREGSFREDLYYRINVVSVEIPPLRERKEDIPELVYLFIREFCLQQNREMVQMDPEVMPALLNYPWPGNVRELRNVVERMVILAEENMILEDHLPEGIRLRKYTPSHFGAESTLTNITDRAEKETILQALESCHGDKSKAAKKLGIPRSTLYYKI